MVIAGGFRAPAFAEGDLDELRAGALKGPGAIVSILRATVAPPVPMGLRGA